MALSTSPVRTDLKEEDGTQPDREGVWNTYGWNIYGVHVWCCSAYVVFMYLICLPLTPELYGIGSFVDH